MSLHSGKYWMNPLRPPARYADVHKHIGHLTTLIATISALFFSSTYMDLDYLGFSFFIGISSYRVVSIVSEANRDHRTAPEKTESD
jgi:hypothetical protein